MGLITMHFLISHLGSGVVLPVLSALCDRISRWPETYQVDQTGWSVSLRDPTFFMWILGLKLSSRYLHSKLITDCAIFLALNIFHWYGKSSVCSR